jgi:uncharacterized membrane protein
MLLSVPTRACVFCNEKVSEGIYNSSFYPNLLTMLSAFIVLAILVAAIAIISKRRRKIRLLAGDTSPDKTPLTMTAIILGIGIGGFIDGIVLHQILQWHEMLSNKIPATTYEGKSINMFWDGIFHGFCTIVVFIGIIRLWQLLRRTDISLSGWLMASGLVTGWGIFNIVEGVIDHHILKLHNVMEIASNHNIANFTFLGVSVLMLVVGYIFYKKA